MFATNGARFPFGALNLIAKINDSLGLSPFCCDGESISRKADYDMYHE